MPWNLFPPARVTTLVVDPMLPPYSAGAVLLRMKFSDGVNRDPPRKPAIHAIYILRPIEEKVVGLGTLSIHRVRLEGAQSARLGQQPGCEGATPACNSPSCEKFRPFSGKSSTSFSVTVLPRELVVGYPTRYQPHER